MSRWLLVGALAGGVMSAWGGEIIFVDPMREKAQALEQKSQPLRHEELRERVLDDARIRSGREVAPPLVNQDEQMPPAAERAREARDYLNDVPATSPAIILRSAPPPSDAAKARQSARSWTSPPPAANSPGNRCTTENTVGGIEGTAQGHTVIQSNTSGVNVICK